MSEVRPVRELIRNMSKPQLLALKDWLDHLIAHNCVIEYCPEIREKSDPSPDETA